MPRPGPSLRLSWRQDPAVGGLQASCHQLTHRGPCEGTLCPVEAGRVQPGRRGTCLVESGPLVLTLRAPEAAPQVCRYLGAALVQATQSHGRVKNHVRQTQPGASAPLSYHQGPSL